MKRSRKFGLILITAAVLWGLLFCIGCTTSSGSLFEEIVTDDSAEEDAPAAGSQGEKPGTEEKSDEKSEEPEQTPGISIDSDPENADVYINGIYQGETPLFLENIDAGEYSVEIKKPGYESEEWWLTFDEGEYLEFEIVLTEVTGFLDVSFIPANAAVYLDGQEISGGVREVRIGRYDIAVRAFGYNPHTEEILIREDETTRVTGQLEPAEFALSGVKISRGVFNPENPGSLGSAAFSFRVTKKGSGRLTIFNADAEAVATHTFPEFSTWHQSYTWDGRNDSGTPLPDGEYTFFLEAGDEIHQFTEQVKVRLDSSWRIFYNSLWNGSGGLLYCPSTDILPPWASQIGISFLGHIEDIDGTTTFRFPLQAGLRLSPYEELELAATAGIIISPKENIPISVSLSGKYRFGNWGFFRMAAAVKGAYLSNDTADTQTNYTGFTLGVPMQLVFGSFNFLFDPEIIISPSRVVYLSSESYSEQPVYLWNYYKTGLFLQFKSIGAGISCALRMLPFSEDYAIHWPIDAGVEFSFVIPGTQLALVLQGAGEFSLTAGYYLMAGLGLALLN